MGRKDRSSVDKLLTIGELVMKSADYLQGKGIDSPRLDAELLLCHILNTDRLHLYMDWQKPLTEIEISGYREFIRRRGQNREPVARIIGTKNFYGHDFSVSEYTFVPRPETEGVVERALMLLEKEAVLKEHRATVLEIGTGTGCIIISIAAESDAHRYIATDVSDKALETARANAKKMKVDGLVQFRHGPLFAGFEGSLSLIVSNPPYIRSEEIPELPPEVAAFDPLPALDGGEDGLDIVRQIVSEGAKLLIHGGWVVLELGEGQPREAADVFKSTGHYSETRVERDLAGIERYLLARRG